VLEGVVAAYLESLSEREFDVPFMALLRHDGFYDVHLLHGQYEFGKDFIAKRDDAGEQHQYAFQTKAGDLTASDWTKIRPQIDELRTSALGHPEFDESLRREARLVITGRLKGKTALLVQEYCERCRQRAEPALRVWDHEGLMEKILGQGDVAGLLKPRAELVAVAAAVDGDQVTASDLETYTRSWVADLADGWAPFLEASVLAHRLHERKRSHLSIALTLALFRAVESCRLSHGDRALIEPAEALAGEIFVTYSDLVLAELSPLLDAADGLLSLHAQSSSAPVSHTVRCCVVAETLALRGLYGLLHGEPEVAREMADRLVRVLQQYPACAHPVSDRYAHTLQVICCLLAACGHRDTLAPYLRGAVKWVCDAYQRGDGLAGVHATEQQEVDQLLGYAFEHVKTDHRRSSYLATTLLDLLALTGENRLYEDAYNDFLAVEVLCCQNLPDGQDRLFSGEGAGTVYGPNIAYDEKIPPGPRWAVASHHRDRPDVEPSPWGALAISGLLRDRHWVHRIAEIVRPAIGDREE